MKLTAEAQQRAIGAVNRLLPIQCNVCKTSSWNLTPELFEIRAFSGGDLHLGASLIPLLVLTCTNCANTIFLNAIQLGVVDAKNPKSAVEPLPVPVIPGVNTEAKS
jgi:hypothetical protein